MKWIRQARTIESLRRQLADEQTSVMLIRIKVNGKLKAEYPITAHRLSMNPPAIPESAWAYGNSAVFTIDVPVVVV